MRGRPSLVSGANWSHCSYQNVRKTSVSILPSINGNRYLVAADFEQPENCCFTDILRAKPGPKTQVPYPHIRSRVHSSNENCLPSLSHSYLSSDGRYTLCDNHINDVKGIQLRPQVSKDHNTCFNARGYLQSQAPVTIERKQTRYLIGNNRNFMLKENPSFRIERLLLNRTHPKPPSLVNKLSFGQNQIKYTKKNHFGGIELQESKLDSHTPKLDTNLNCNADRDDSSDRDVGQEDDLRHNQDHNPSLQSRTEDDARESLIQTSISNFVEEVVGLGIGQFLGEMAGNEVITDINLDSHETQDRYFSPGENSRDSLETHFMAAVSRFVAEVEERAIKQLTTELADTLTRSEMLGPKTEFLDDQISATYDIDIPYLIDVREPLESFPDESTKNKDVTSRRDQARSRPIATKMKGEPSKDSYSISNIDSRRELDLDEFVNILELKFTDDEKRKSETDDEILSPGLHPPIEDTDFLLDSVTLFESIEEGEDMEGLLQLREQLRSGQLTIHGKAVESIKIQRRKRRRKGKKKRLKERGDTHLKLDLHRPAPFISFVHPKDYLPIPPVNYLPSYPLTKLPVPWGARLPLLNGWRDSPEVSFCNPLPLLSSDSLTAFSYQRATKHYSDCQLRMEGNHSIWP